MRLLIMAAILAAGALAGCGTGESQQAQSESSQRCPCCTVPNCKCGECKDVGGCPCPPTDPPKEPKLYRRDPPSMPGAPAPSGLSPN
jgi:hypothetical protein